ncbi:MAG: hypothetical protein FJZ04_03865 [Candidatus Moranbacteria bacterium]|nr:hypothetical protein [Candidatus Moranbacteria bacterium]
MNNSQIKKVVFVGLILTVILTLPTSWHFFTGIPGRGADTYQAIARTLLVENKVESTGWLNTFRWQKDVDFWGILPLIGYTQALIGTHAGYNFWWLASFFLAFLGMWLLVRDITRSKWAALGSGFIFAFSPYHFAQASATNIGMMHYEWLPWLMFFLNRLFQTVSWKNVLGTTLMFILIVTTEHQLTAFSLIFLIFFIPFLFFQHKGILRRWQFWLVAVIGLTVILLVGIVQYQKIWGIAHSENNYLIPPYYQVENYSADLVDFFLPARFQSFWGERLNSARANLASNQEGRQSLYLGFLVIILTLIGLASVFKKNNEPDQKQWIIFAGACAFLFLVLSLGPTLHINGQGYLSGKMPYSWLYNFIPFWDYIRTVSRIFVIALLGIAILAGFGIKKLEGFLLKAGLPRYVKVLLIGIFAVGIPLEYSAIPTPQIDLRYSAFYDELKKEPERFSILEIPGATSYEFGSYSTFTSSIHQKNKIDGIDFARAEKGRFSFQRNTPIIEALLYDLPTNNKELENINAGSSDIVITNYIPIAKSILSFYDIRYITVSKSGFGKNFTAQEYINTTNFIEQSLGLTSSYEDSLLKAYTVPQEKNPGVFLAIDTGANDSWGQKEGEGKSRRRPAKDGARMRLTNVGNDPINLQIDFKANIKYLRRLKILLDSTPVKDFYIKEFKGDYNFPLDNLAPGEHKLEFRISDESGRPITDFQDNRGVKFSHFQTLVK